MCIRCIQTLRKGKQYCEFSIILRFRWHIKVRNTTPGYHVLRGKDITVCTDELGAFTIFHRVLKMLKGT